MSIDAMLEKTMGEMLQKAARGLLKELTFAQSEFIKNGIKLSFNEADAAKFLNIGTDALAEIRKAGGIGYSQIIAPPRGKNHGGRFIYLLSDLLDYAARNHVKPAGAEIVSLNDVLSGKVVDLKSYKKEAA